VNDSSYKTIKLMRQCDIPNTALCEIYKKKQWCRYAFSHGITNCPFTGVTPYDSSETTVKKEDKGCA